MTFCIHVPMFERNVPPQTKRKSRWRSAAPAVPRLYVRSASTSASVASSAAGSCARRNNIGRRPYGSSRGRRPELVTPSRSA